MSTSTVSKAQELPLDALVDLLEAQNVISDKTERAFYSTDVYARAAIDAALVLKPQSVNALAQSVRICTDHGLAVIPRGGGLSYTGGFLPTRPDSVIIDMLGLNRIVEINETDMYVTVECGVSWKALYEALKPLGLRTPPISAPCPATPPRWAGPFRKAASSWDRPNTARPPTASWVWT